MASYGLGRPGVFIQENTVQQDIATNESSNAIAAFVGYLKKGPTTPTLITSWSDFVRLYGTLDFAVPTSIAVYLFFANGGRDAYVRRVVTSAATAASVTLTNTTPANTVSVTAKNVGDWGNQYAVEVNGTASKFALTVYGPPLNSTTASQSNPVEQFTDLSMTKTDARYFKAIINATSSYITVDDIGASTAAGTVPANDGLHSLTGGVSSGTVAPADFVGTGKVFATGGASSADFDSISVPLIFNLPDASSASWVESSVGSTVNSVIKYVEARGDGFVIVDALSTNTTAANAISFAGSVSTVSSIDGGQSAMYFPWVTIPDTSKAIRGITATVAPGGAIAGIYQQTDASRGVFKSPAGYSTRLTGVVGLATTLSNTDLDTLNQGLAYGGTGAAYPVNALKVTPGAGICVMGARTLSTTSANRYISVRRSLIYLKKELTDRTNFAVFENNDALLWNKITSSVANFLNIYWQSGGLRGSSPDQAFFVKCDSTTNSDADIANGRVNVQVGVALEYPAEFVLITIGQITGDATV